MIKLNKNDKKADDLFRKYIRARDGGKCRECGTTYQPTVAHLIRKGYDQTRWEGKNAVILCFTHHRYFTDNPKKWTAWCIRKFGAGFWARLVIQSQNRDFQKIDYDELFKQLKGKLDAITKTQGDF